MAWIALLLGVCMRTNCADWGITTGAAGEQCTLEYGRWKSFI